MTFSAGVAEIGLHGEDVHAAHRAADEALYAAKALGRQRVMLAGGPPAEEGQPRDAVMVAAHEAPAGGVCGGCGRRT